ncbi:MAG: DUF4430 domain-containing protein [Porcipelethomonas sp.]
MKMTGKLKRTLSGFLCVVLVAAMAPLTIGCDDTDNGSASSVSESAESGVRSVGEGETQFDFTVTDKDGNETKFEVNTDKTTVGEALVDAKLVEGEESDYGLYVKTVNGVTLDFDTDGYYWAFYVNGEYAQTGVDSTDIKEGETYEFKAEQG